MTAGLFLMATLAAATNNMSEMLTPSRRRARWIQLRFADRLVLQMLVSTRPRSKTMKPGITAAALILLAASIAGTALAQGPGADIYKARCVSCHGADGLAATPAGKNMKIRPFRDPQLVKWSDAQFIAFIKEAYKKYGLTDAQVKDLVAYIRKFQK